MKRSPLRRRAQLRAKTELTRTAMPRERTRMKQVSDRRRREDRQRSRLRAQLEKDRGLLCEAKFAGCHGRWKDMHEVKTRARGGSILDVSNIRLLCRNCHAYITEHPAWAEAHGWVKSQWDVA